MTIMKCVSSSEASADRYAGLSCDLFEIRLEKLACVRFSSRAERRIIIP